MIFSAPYWVSYKEIAKSSVKNNPSADVKTKSWDELMDGKEYRSATPENFDLNEIKN